MNVTFTRTDELLSARLYGEIDHHTARDMRMLIDSEIEGTLPKSLILDFSEVQFMDSSGIGMIMGRYKKVQKLGGKVIISSATPQIKRIIEMAGLHGIMQLAPDLKKALKKL